MKKKVLLVICCILLIGGIFLAYILVQESRVDCFNLSDFQKYIDSFSIDDIVSPIQTDKDAKDQAEKIWTKIFDKETAEFEKPYVVYYDSKNDAWLVQGTLPPNYIGGVANMIALSDGKVLAVWHTK